MARTYAGVLGASAFVTVLLRGLLLGGGIDATLGRAVVGLAVFAVVGLIAGQIAEMTVTESVKARINQELQHQNQHQTPTPDKP